MAQFGRPSADTFRDTAWTEDDGTTDALFGEIDESVASDTDYIKTSAAPTSDVYVTKLTSLEDPVSSSGHVLRARIAKDASGGAQIDFTVELRQGYASEASPGTLICTIPSTSDVSNSFTDYSHTLSGAEADSITDYTDLYVRIVANQV